MFPVAFLGLRLQAYLDLLQILIGYKLGCLVLFQSSTPQISKKSSVWLVRKFVDISGQLIKHVVIKLRLETNEKKTLTHWW